VSSYPNTIFIQLVTPQIRKPLSLRL
jgi:hypothetical protein